MRLFLLTLHVLGAVVALGFSLSYGLWIRRGEVVGATERSFALRTVSWVDRRFTTPAYVLQLVTGLLLVAVTDWARLRQSWLAISLGLYVLLTVLAIVRFAPAHRARTALAERLSAGEPVQAEYDAAAARATRIGVLVTVLTVTIAVLMVWKPIWW
ncbi:MAG TPA: DUF2269 family protein [Actinomycetota bacterium]